MAKALDRRPHSCGTRRGLVVFAPEEEGGNVKGYCFACDTKVPNPYGEERKMEDVPKPKEMSKEDVEALLKEVRTYPQVDLPHRNIGAKTLQDYGVHVGLSEADGETPCEVYWPLTKNGELVGYKVKVIDTEGKTKYTFQIGDAKDSDLIGWDVALKSGASRLIITEGEEDMASVYKVFQMYSKRDSDKNIMYPVAVVSLPRGASSARKVLQKHRTDIQRLFRDVVLCFDNDEAGNEAVKEASIVIPSAKNVTLPYKDANETLMKGLGKRIFELVSFNSSKAKNTRIVSAASIFDAAKVPPKWGDLSWPFPSLNDLTRGIRYGETIYIGAGVKMGKSELVNTLAAHFIKEHEVPIFSAKPEESNIKTVKLVAGKMVGKVFHDPKVEFDEEAFESVRDLIGDKLQMLDLYQHMGWDTLKEDIIQAAGMGCKVIFIDPITNLTNGVSSGDANTQLQGIAQDLSALANDLGIVVFIFCHLRTPEGTISDDARIKKYKQNKYIGIGNCSHELGGNIYSNQFAGSRGMMRSCNYMLGLEGNKDVELPENIRNVRHLCLLEDREFGEVGRIPLYWDRRTTFFNEIEND